MCHTKFWGPIANHGNEIGQLCRHFWNWIKFFSDVFSSVQVHPRLFSHRKSRLQCKKEVLPFQHASKFRDFNFQESLVSWSCHSCIFFLPNCPVFPDLDGVCWVKIAVGPLWLKEKKEMHTVCFLWHFHSAASVVTQNRAGVRVV